MKGRHDESILTRIISTINHNADLLERHLNEGIYVHYQQEPSMSWAVTHSLGSLRPLIEVYDSNGNRIGFAVNRQTQTLSFAEINFAIAVSGIAIFRY